MSKFDDIKPELVRDGARRLQLFLHLAKNMNGNEQTDIQWQIIHIQAAAKFIESEQRRRKNHKARVRKTKALGNKLIRQVLKRVVVKR